MTPFYASCLRPYRWRAASPEVPTSDTKRVRICLQEGFIADSMLPCALCDDRFPANPYQGTLQVGATPPGHRTKDPKRHDRAGLIRQSASWPLDGLAPWSGCRSAPSSTIGAGRGRKRRRTGAGSRPRRTPVRGGRAGRRTGRLRRAPATTGPEPRSASPCGSSRLRPRRVEAESRRRRRSPSPPTWRRAVGRRRGLARAARSPRGGRERDRRRRADRARPSPQVGMRAIDADRPHRG